MIKKFWPKKGSSPFLPGLIYSCSFEGNANDNVGSHNGASTNITYSTANGWIQQGAGFTSSGSRINILSFITTVSNIWTISAYVKINAQISLYGGIIVNGISNSFGLYFQNAVSKFTMYASGDNFNNTTISPGVWYNVTVTNGPSGLKIYLNSVLDSPAYPQIGPLMLNELGNDSVSEWLSGDIDIVSIWDYELTALEVADYYAVTQVKQYPF